MKNNLPGTVYYDVVEAARKHGLEKLVLFGSRAAGRHTEHSDVDLAAAGGDIDAFFTDIDELDSSLLTFDVVDLARANAELLSEIERDGITLYEKA